MSWSSVKRGRNNEEVSQVRQHELRGKRGQGLHELIPQLRTQKHILDSILLFKAVPKDNFTSRSVMNVIVRGTFGLVR